MTVFETDASGEPIDSSADDLVHAAKETGLLEIEGVAQEEAAEIASVTNALARLREAERSLTESARSALQVSAQEFRALQFIVIAHQGGRLVSPSMLSDHLGVSAASVTKLLNKLEAGQHVTRLLHPHDRRAIQIVVSPQAQALVQRSVGRQQARRFHAAAQLSSSERVVVARFLNDITHHIQADQAKWTLEAKQR